MNLKTKTILYWIATIIMCGIFLYSALMYLFKTEMIEGFFKDFNYPTYIVIPLAISKILGVFVVLTRRPKWLMEWAYAGFFFDLVLASMAHYHAGHPIGLSVYAIPLLFISYFFGKQVRQ